MALGDVRAEVGLLTDERIPDEILIAEALALGDPETYPSLEAVIPGGDAKRADQWFTERLEGRADTAKEREALARRMCPPPNEQTEQSDYGGSRRVIERAIIYMREHPAPGTTATPNEDAESGSNFV